MQTGAGWALFLDVLIYLFERENYREKEGETGREIFHPCFATLMVTVTRAGPGWNQELGSSSRFPMRMAGVQTLRPPSAAFPRPLTGNWVRSRETGVWIGTHVGCWSHRQTKNDFLKILAETVIENVWSISLPFRLSLMMNNRTVPYLVKVSLGWMGVAETIPVSPLGVLQHSSIHLFSKGENLSL